MGKRRSGYKKRPLSVSILQIARFIMKYPGIYVRAISQSTKLPVSTVFVAVDRLHSLGLLEKKPIISADIPLPNLPESLFMKTMDMAVVERSLKLEKSLGR